MDQSGVRFPIGPPNLICRRSLMKTRQDLNKAFSEHISQHKQFKEVLRVVKDNSEGKIWLIGGFLYKTLASILYGQGVHIKDFDFIIEKMKSPLVISKDWEESKTGFDNPKLKNGNLIVDLVPLNNIHSVQRRNLKPSIENYLSGTPLTVQSLAFDVVSQEIIGEVGLKSLFDEVIEINNQESYVHVTNKWGSAYSTRKADDLNFELRV